MNTVPESIPIIVFHKGYAPYLETCLKQARKMNPDSRIILLGDDANAHLSYVEHFNANRFPGFVQFKPLYRHCSHLPVWLEHLWIERWFAMRDFVHQTGIQRFLHIDTDVLLFCNVTEEVSRFDGYDMTFARWDEQRLMAHFFLLNNTNFLDDFCNYMTNLYSDENEFQRVVQKNTNRKKNRILPPWICDMSLLCDYYDLYKPNAYFLEKTVDNGVAFDNRITDSNDKFQTEWGLLRKQRIKKIRFENDIPTGRLLDNTPIPMKILHYHSFTKYLMPYHVQGLDAHKRFFWHTFLFEHKFLKKK